MESVTSTFFFCCNKLVGGTSSLLAFAPPPWKKSKSKNEKKSEKPFSWISEFGATKSDCDKSGKMKTKNHELKICHCSCILYCPKKNRGNISYFIVYLRYITWKKTIIMWRGTDWQWMWGACFNRHIYPHTHSPSSVTHVKFFILHVTKFLVPANGIGKSGVSGTLNKIVCL